MGLFDDDTPDYMKSQDDGDEEYNLGATYTRPTSADAPKAPATSPAAQALRMEEERKKAEAAKAAGDAEAARRAREFAEYQAKQAAIARDMELAKATAARIGTPSPKQPTSAPKPAQAAPILPSGSGFIPSTPADVQAAMSTVASGGSYDIVPEDEGRPMWQYAVGGTVALGGLFLLGRYVVLPMLRRR